jgi:hypothetical protein
MGKTLKNINFQWGDSPANHGANCQSGLSDWVHFVVRIRTSGNIFLSKWIYDRTLRNQRPNLPSIITNQPSSLKFVAKIGKDRKNMEK